MFRMVFAGLALGIITGPALATQCPALWQQINEKMQVSHLSDADKAKLTEFRQQGDTMHHAGQHAESMAALSQALALLEGAGGG